jgi:hypothetical protein
MENLKSHEGVKLNPTFKNKIEWKKINAKKIWKVSKVMKALITKIEGLKLSPTFKDKIEWKK